MYSPKILIIAYALILTGCVSLAPEYQRPNFNLPHQFSGNVSDVVTRDKTARDKTELAIPSWSQFIQDPQMKSVIEIALEKNSDLYLAALDVEEARVRFGLAGAEKYPQISSSMSGDYGQSLESGSSFNKKYSAGVDISYELDFFGRIKNLSDADKAKFIASQEMKRATQIITIKTVAEAYLDVVYNQKLLLIAQETKQSYLNSQSIVMQKVAAGKAALSDLEQAKGQVQSISINIEKIESEIAKNENLLNFLTNDYVTKINLDLGRYEPNYPLITTPSDIPSEILLKRPDIMAAEQNIISENASIGVARAAFFPSISFNTGIENSNDSLTGLFDSSNGIWNFIPKITLPIFTGGTNSRNLELANIRKNKAIANYEKSIQVAFREVKDALVIKSSLEKQLISQVQYVNTLQNVLTQKQASYRYGSLSYLDVLEAQRSLFTEQQNLLMLKIEQQKNEINLFSALGGGLIKS
ncbi:MULTISPECIES: efflux transporter outer membrane subunit [Providencia]|uniref:Efflux transporter outer membrane subunit n=1 Tax=Providencia huaxiensis TaxID=2027290 RepID=A0ABU2IUS5_9GAMM|nr:MULTISPECIES: efflux transporter outer membrane subunit [Providencia]MBZ3683164.1 efflux transporter outer membrane subunit [Providencia rettgeri]AXH62750.1 efflux transporter outer membrane subunit [Providencia huaxiensis]MDT0132400.1 efflux transporter outer membrane subunit [Providencia huaxiensis]MDT1978806.1 efflux transporter outer membrane subunit [Providencia huaxiensis]QLR01920.1 efflux transporter outer membrane subunit [Providencia rettgeri]